MLSAEIDRRQDVLRRDVEELDRDVGIVCNFVNVVTSSRRKVFRQELLRQSKLHCAHRKLDQETDPVLARGGPEQSML